MFDLSGKTAIVTGSTQGIGFDIAKLFSIQGAKVFVCGSGDFEKCEKAAKEISGSVPVVVNLLDEDAAEKLYAATGDVDILVLNASIQYKRKWDEFTLEEYNIQMDCNVKSSYLLIKKYVNGMKKKGWGRIVTVGSVNQYNQHPELSIYGMSKVAQKKMVENFASIFAPFGITINNISPGAIDTPRNAAAFEDEKFKQKVAGSIPCGYIGKPSDISPAVLLLCSDEGRYITGSEIIIDGGMHL